MLFLCDQHEGAPKYASNLNPRSWSSTLVGHSFLHLAPAWGKSIGVRTNPCQEEDKLSTPSLLRVGVGTCWIQAPCGPSISVRVQPVSWRPICWQIRSFYTSDCKSFRTGLCDSRPRRPGRQRRTAAAAGSDEPALLRHDPKQCMNLMHIPSYRGFRTRSC